MAVLAAIPRVRDRAALGLDHYDTGSYALAAESLAAGGGLEGLPDHMFKMCPPAYYGGGAILMKLAGLRSEDALTLLSIVYGALTAPLVALLGALWFGRIAGVAAGLLVAGSDFHVAFSRTALTDVSFGFWYLAALLALTLADRRNSLAWAAVAGIAAGITWNTKYLGLFVPVTAGMALLARLSPFDGRALLRAAARVAVLTGIAVLTYLPWYFYVERQPGGYAALNGLHSRYLNNAVRVLGHLETHFGSQQVLDGLLSRLAIAGAFLAAGFGARLGARGWTVLAGGLAAALAASTVIPAAAILAVLGVCGFLAVGIRNAAKTPIPLAFFILLAATTPVYHPFARIAIPLMLATTLFAGAALQAAALRLAVPRAALPASSGRRAAAIAAALAAAAFVAACLPFRGPAIPTSTRTFEEAAKALDQKIPAGVPIAVVGEPPLVVYLRTLGREALLVNDPETIGAIWPAGTRLAIVEGLYVRRTGLLARWLEKLEERPTDDGEIAIDVGAVRLLDDFAPTAVRTDPRVRKASNLRLYSLTVPRT